MEGAQPYADAAELAASPGAAQHTPCWQDGCAALPELPASLNQLALGVNCEGPDGARLRSAIRVRSCWDR